MKKTSFRPIQALFSAALCAALGMGNAQAESSENNRPDEDFSPETTINVASYAVDDDGYAQNRAALLEDMTVEYPVSASDIPDSDVPQDSFVPDMAALSVTAALFAQNQAAWGGGGKRPKKVKSSKPGGSRCVKPPKRPISYRSKRYGR